MSEMKCESMGEMPPSTRGNSGFSRRSVRVGAITMSENCFQAGSILKSQCDRLLGSFHSITASTIHAPGRAGVLKSAREFLFKDALAFFRYLAGKANPCFRLGMGFDLQAGAAQHCFHAAMVWNPPVCRISGILFFDEVHAGKIRAPKNVFVPEVIILVKFRARKRAAHHG